MANILEPINNTKNFKSLLTNLLHRGPFKTTLQAAGWAALAYSLIKIDHMDWNHRYKSR